MRNLLFILICSFICFASCKSDGKGNSTTKSNANKIDTIWNDKVQDTFFGVKFGATKDSVIAGLKNQGFYFNTSLSTDNLLHFHSNSGQYFSFGNLNWEMLAIGLNDGKFNFIRFMNASEDKAAALSNFNSLKNAVSAKYDLTVVAPKDTTIYDCSAVFAKNNKCIAIYCSRYETISKNIMIGVNLEYYDLNESNEVSSEL